MYGVIMLKNKNTILFANLIRSVQSNCSIVCTQAIAGFGLQTLCSVSCCLPNTIAWSHSNLAGALPKKMQDSGYKPYTQLPNNCAGCKPKLAVVFFTSKQHCSSLAAMRQTTQTARKLAYKNQCFLP